MRRVDEHLAARELAAPPDAERDLASAAPPAQLDDLDRQLRRLRQMRAPLFVVGGWGPADLWRRLLNLPIALLGYKQRRFNEELLGTLDLTLETLRDLHALVERQSREIERLREQQADQRRGP